MDTKEFRITVPDGYEIDKDNSTFECIKFKPLCLTYEDIAKSLFKDKSGYFIYEDGSIKNTQPVFTRSYTDINNATSKKQLEKLLAMNKIMNVAIFLNKGWEPDWEDERDHKYFFGIEEDEIYVNETNTSNESFCYFSCPAIAQRAASILGDDTIRLALSTDW